MFDYSVRHSGSVATVILKGDLEGMRASDSFRDILHELLISGMRAVVIDMNGLESINSHGIGKLLLFYKKFKDAGKELSIWSPQGKVRETLEVLMLDRLFKIEQI